MTPKELAISILKAARRNDLHKARIAFADMTPEQMQESYGQGGQTRQQILNSFEKRDTELEAAIKWAEQHETERQFVNQSASVDRETVEETDVRILHGQDNKLKPDRCNSVLIGQAYSFEGTMPAPWPSH